MKSAKVIARYSLYKYSYHHWAIDCEECDRKIANLRSDKISGETIDQLNKHEEKRHPAVEKEETK